jgi:hydroxymethylpyrimidine kinase/phosphomethylpyrimidine kinase
MSDLASTSTEGVFRPIVLNGLYPGLPRGLTADVLTTQALGGRPYPVCTTHIAAGRGTVTDVLSVPSDTVAAHLEHLLATELPTCAKVGIVSDAPTIRDSLKTLSEALDGPIILDVTLSGPSGEDIVAPGGVDVLLEHVGKADLVTVRRTDAALLAGMEIPSLDDAQVAVQRLVQRGAQEVLLRCGRIPTHHFDTEGEPPKYAVDLYYDGEDFALYEAPFLDDVEAVHGASSGLLLPVLKALTAGTPTEEALQSSKAHVTEALKTAQSSQPSVRVQTFFNALRHNQSMIQS